jgi:uncharacterized membrane protein YtjA (UPF0391 family)
MTYWLTDPGRNINLIFGFGSSGAGPTGSGHLLFMMAAIPLLIYLPTHLLLKKFFS